MMAFGSTMCLTAATKDCDVTSKQTKQEKGSLGGRKGQLGTEQHR